MNTASENRERESTSDEEEEGSQSFWAWFALGVLMFCWIAEASMCAVRGF